LLPHTPKVVLSDNGSEFEADFARLLEDRGIKRWYTYPKNPKMNAHAERFNRTIQESFVDYHEELLFTDLALFNRKLANWLVFYNTERPPIPSASNLRYHSSCNINPSAKGTGPIQQGVIGSSLW
jgi:transposase InsO family protein